MSSLINNGSVCSSLSETESILTIFCSDVRRVKIVLHALSQTTTQYISHLNIQVYYKLVRVFLFKHCLTLCIMPIPLATVFFDVSMVTYPVNLTVNYNFFYHDETLCRKF